MKPLDVATDETVRFAMAHIARGSMVLEIGCGSGDVAAALQHLGYGVTAIDSDLEAVRQTLAKGVRAVAAHWPAAVIERVDTVLFTRSLHHVRDLRGAIAAAQRAARLLLVEDFDFASADRATVEWLAAKVHAARDEGFLREDVDEFATRVATQLSGPPASSPADRAAFRAARPGGGADAATSAAGDGGAPDAWHAEHDHDLHSADAILAAVRERFDVLRVEDVPYAYRYLIPVIEETKRAAIWLRNVLDEERARSRVIGRRIVAHDSRANRRFDSGQSTP